jgi:hypothetical protein
VIDDDNVLEGRVDTDEDGLLKSLSGGLRREIFREFDISNRGQTWISRSDGVWRVSLSWGSGD